ncbi:hypothetical protein [Maribacter arcticus]|uniref:Uncharacterized protein n=1 Tax=Maribacter arcticus TaxID=561365 RepID=A0A1T5B4K9_9FLAO|nr:hypothetical protein [Maribacter arcticus]SKB42194.1 hypothetical protein SAMN05660866_01414 [Maribacter arcticus]
MTALLLISVATAQDGTITPLETPEEPTAIPLNTGGVDDQPVLRDLVSPMGRSNG